MAEQYSECKQTLYDLTELRGQPQKNSKIQQLVSLLTKQNEIYANTVSHMHQQVSEYRKNLKKLAIVFKIDTAKDQSTSTSPKQLQQLFQRINESVILLIQDSKKQTKRVEVPIFVEKEVIVERRIEVPVEVEKIVVIEKIIEVERLIEVEKPVFVEKIVQKIVEIEKIIEVPVEVPVYIQKIVEIMTPVYIEREVQVEKQIIVERIIEAECPNCNRG